MIALLIKSAIAVADALPMIEYHIYRLDEQYQEHVIPWIAQGAVLGLEAIARCCIWFWKASIWTFVAGQKVGAWYVQWMADYCNQIPLIDTDVEYVFLDPWNIEFPEFHVPKIFGLVRNPEYRDMHQEVARLLALQTVPLMLPPAVEVVEVPAVVVEEPKKVQRGRRRK